MSHGPCDTQIVNDDNSYVKLINVNDPPLCMTTAILCCLQPLVSNITYAVD